MVRLANARKLTPKVVADLGDRSQCKASFGLNHPFLQKVIPDAHLQTQGIDEKGYSRYWRDPLDIDARGSSFVVSGSLGSGRRSTVGSRPSKLRNRRTATDKAPIEAAARQDFGACSASHVEIARLGMVQDDCGG
jgi:hypothetical protein